MQAVRIERKKSRDSRWLQHLSLLGAAAFLLSWVVATRPEAAHQLVEGFPSHFLAPPSMPAQEWRPVRVPVRTSTVRDPAPPATIGLPTVADQSSGAVAAQLSAEWVQAHRRTVLLSAPEDGAARELDVPQWSYLKVLETRHDGWLRVGYGSNGSGQPVGVAWVPVTDIGISGPPPRFVTSVRDVPLWSADGPGAEPVAVAPRFATLELAGAERNGRVAVRVADTEWADRPLAWVDWDAVSGGRGPAEREAPRPLARPFSPFVGSVRLDVPYRTQLDGSISAQANCGPTSIAMALESFGVYIPTSQSRAIATRSMGIFSPWSGTTLESLRDVARTYGLEGLDLHENGRYKRWTLDDVRRHLRAGHPVIPQLRYRLMPGREWTWVGFDHYVVINGMDGDDFIITDPVPHNGRGERTITAQQLLRAWMGSDQPGAALAVARPL